MQIFWLLLDIFSCFGYGWIQNFLTDVHILRIKMFYSIFTAPLRNFRTIGIRQSFVTKNQVRVASMLLFSGITSFLLSDST